MFNRATRKYDLSENNNVASDPKVQNFFSSIQFNQSVICPSTLESLQENGIWGNNDVNSKVKATVVT